MAPSRREFEGIDPRVLAGMEGLELRARRVVEGYVSGMHRSPFHGFSQEFAEHREYTPGDDLRYVDWKVFGRTDKHYLKRFEEETNLVAHLLLDVSPSMDYRSGWAALSKRSYAETAAAALAYLVLRQQDSTALATFSSIVESILPPGGAPSHLRHVVQRMREAQGHEATRIGPVLHELAERFPKRGVVVVLSDFLDDADNILGGVRHFAHRRHETILLQVLDPAEVDFPFNDQTQFEGLEREPAITTNPRAVRKAYLARLEAHQRKLMAGCRACGVDHVLLRTDRPVEAALTEYLTTRSRFFGQRAAGRRAP